MPSSYSTDLKLELQVTGENAGTWGDITNTNLVLLQQAIAGYQTVSIAGGAQTTALAMTNATISNARNAVIELTGTITGNQIVTVPDGIEKIWTIYNNTTGAFTVQFKTVSGTGYTFGTTDKSTRIFYSNGTNIVDPGFVNTTGTDTLTNKTLTSPTISSPTITTAATINAQGELRLADSDSSNYVGFKSGATVTTNTVWTLPTADGTANQVLQTNGTGTLSFTTISGGGVAFETSLRTSSFTAVAGTGYLIDSSSATIDVTLPASPTTGAQISLLDATSGVSANPINILRNGNNIVGQARNTSIILARQGITLVYAGATQGWNLVGDFNPNASVGNPINTYPIEFYMIAGGGGGGADDGGGGGGGGSLTGYFVGVKGTTYTITVGAGGASNATRGGSSSILGTGVSIFSLGGGTGGGESAPSAGGSQGGCGGGGGGYGAGPAGGQAIQTYTPFMNLSNYNSEGNIGGFTGGDHPTGNGGAAGGGGTGAKGGTVNSNAGGQGGAGASTSITGSSATYGGGGGGKGRGSQGQGGSGGGGAAQAAGQANTGGGGGGSGDQQTTAPSGGSGRVILKFPTSIAGSSTGSPTSGTTGGYTTLSYTGSGTYTA